MNFCDGGDIAFSRLETHCLKWQTLVCSGSCPRCSVGCNHLETQFNHFHFSSLTPAPIQTIPSQSWVAIYVRNRKRKLCEKYPRPVRAKRGDQFNHTRGICFWHSGIRWITDSLSDIGLFRERGESLSGYHGISALCGGSTSPLSYLVSNSNAGLQIHHKSVQHLFSRSIFACTSRVHCHQKFDLSV